MTEQRPTVRPARAALALWSAAFPLGFALLLLGQRDAGAAGTAMVVGAVVCFAVAVAAVAADVRGTRVAARA